MSRKLSVVHVINSFQFGGAEKMLCNLVLRTDRDRFDTSVVSLIDDMSVAGPLLDAGIPIKVIGMRPGVPDPLGIAKLARHFWRVRPDVIQCWMDHSNLIGGIAARFAPAAPVVWGIHHSNHIKEITKRSTLATVWAGAKLSRRLASRIVCCSEYARGCYADRGFGEDLLTVIPNGFDTELFRPDPAARAAVRNELCISPATLLVGLIARYDPFKDHETFLRTAAILAKQRADVQFLLCGHGVDQSNNVLMAMIGSLGIADRCHLLGARNDVPRILTALDVCAQSSVSEAFPLVLGEAMACGVPCAATHVGDTALIVGPYGRVVPQRDPEALAAGCAELLAMKHSSRQQLGQQARHRVREMFDLGAVTRRYEQLYHELATQNDRATAPTREPARAHASEAIA
jgi:glycosyltransferase involved in cell wall biosynthesis